MKVPVLAIGLLGGSWLGLRGCDAAGTGSGEVVITAETLEQLPPGARLRLERKGDDSISFDFSEAAIDWSRIDVVTRSGQTLAMSELFAVKEAQVVLRGPERAFRLARRSEDAGSPGFATCLEYLDPSDELRWVCVDL
jgi:hypothetical protein